MGARRRGKRRRALVPSKQKEPSEDKDKKSESQTREEESGKGVRRIQSKKKGGQGEEGA